MQLYLHRADELARRSRRGRYGKQPSNRGGDRYEVQEIHLACCRVHLDIGGVESNGSVVLDDEVAADRLDVDHAPTEFVVEHAGGLVAARARLVLLVRESEQPRLEVDLFARYVE